MAKNDDEIIVTSSTLLDQSLFDSPVTIAIKGDWKGRQVKASRGNHEFMPKVEEGLLMLDIYPTDSVVVTLR